jgi:hypothetical protein
MSQQYGVGRKVAEYITRKEIKRNGLEADAVKWKFYV